MAITEAAMDNWSGFYLGVRKTAGGVCTLETHLSPLPWEEPESWANLKKYEEGVKVRFDDVIRSSWRLVMIADNPGRFIESEAIHSLNEPCAIEDPSWIKPGLSAWDHWWSGEVKVDMPTIKEYIDFASQMGWPYMLIDWQWYGPYAQPGADITKAAPQLDMPEILAYADDRNVRCWLWIHSDDAARNNAFYDAFPLYRDWGVAGVKIDFMDREDQEMVRWYRKVIERAAECHLMVDFHGAYKPDGIDRTWPNMMTREGVLGSEYYKFAQDRQLPTPEHNVTLAFTRMLAGQMDYTPGGFLNVRREDWKRQTPALVCDTRCAELAKFVIYDSPYMVFCDHPKHVLGQPGADFLQIVPTVWDDTRFLGGAPEEYGGIRAPRQALRRHLVRGRTEQFREKEGLYRPGLPPGRHPHGHGLDGRQENRQGPEDPGKESLESLPGQAAGNHDGIRGRLRADGGIKFVQTFVFFRILPYLCGRKRKNQTITHMTNIFSLEGKNAWITGASYGIGFNIAKAFVEAGIQNIIFNDISEAALERGLNNYKEAGITNVHGYVCDVTKEDDVKALVEKIHEEVGQIDILVNNAGIIKRIPMHEMKRSEFQAVIDVDLVAPFIVSSAVLPEMMERREGKIINICSMMSELGRETVSAYAAAKGGLKMLTRNICSEYGEYNIQCNGIGPGYIATPQTAPLRERQPDGSRHPFDSFICAKTPAGRWLDPSELGGPAVFLASHASDAVNGHILYVDGGILAYIGKQPK